MSKTVNMVKLSVGTEDIAGLAAWQATGRAQSSDGYPQHVTRMEATPKRAFQGWRYLPVDDAPADLPEGRQDDTPLPPELSKALAAIGVR